MIAVTRRSPSAMRMARSTRWRTCGAVEACSTKAPATSLNSDSQIDFLLVMAAHRVARLLAGDGEHRHMIEPRVIEPGDQMRCAGTGRRDADAEFAGEFGIGRSHEGGHFLVPRLDEFDLAVGAIERAEHAIDAVAGIAENFAHAPRVKPLDKEIAHSFGHALTLRRNASSGFQPNDV